MNLSQTKKADIEPTFVSFKEKITYFSAFT
jgi:hypothetical protein